MQSKLNIETIRNTEYFKSMDAAFKVGLTIYVENNLKKVPTTYTHLSQVLGKDVDKEEIIGALRDLGEWLLVEARYGATHDGRAGRILYLTWTGEQQFERNYREIRKEIRKTSRDVRELKRNLEEVQARKDMEMRGETPDGHRLGDLTDSLARPGKNGKSPLEEAIDEMYKDGSLPPKK